MADKSYLEKIFAEWNASHFQGMLHPPELRWNARLSSSAGRFYPKRASRWSLWPKTPVIEIATYLLKEDDSEKWIRDTLGHEMIHQWLWQLGRPYGHTAEFRKKMKELGVSRYNLVPRRRAVKYQYHCPSCGLAYPSRKRIVMKACGRCCRAHAGGKYDSRFKLILDNKLPSLEALGGSVGGGPASRDG